MLSLARFFAAPPDADTSGPTGHSAEARLAERIRDGDTAAFEIVFLDAMPRLCNFAMHYLRSRDEAQDVVQDVFARLWRTRATLRAGGSLSSYLYTSVRNAALNRLRHAGVAAELSADVMADGEPVVMAVDSALEIMERQAAVARAVGELPARQRTICLLRWTEGLTYREIAHRLGIAEKTVDAHLQRAIRTIREKVAGL
jgi:RNA polymerase sigma-70 factor (family 1)